MNVREDGEQAGNDGSEYGMIVFLLAVNVATHGSHFITVLLICGIPDVVEAVELTLLLLRTRWDYLALLTFLVVII
jgi:hypothetical protein